MKNQKSNPQEILKSMIGGTIEELSFIVHEFQKEKSYNDIFLYIKFQSGKEYYFGSDSGGETLRIRSESWFYYPENDDDEETYNAIGKFVKDDSDYFPEAKNLIGKKISSHKLIANKFGTTCGVQFNIENVFLNFVVEFDEGVIYWGKQNKKMFASFNENRLLE